MAEGRPESPKARWLGTSDSPEQTAGVGEVVAEFARAGDVVALVGEFGSGKTQFVRGMAGRLATGDAPVASPTFVMIHEYEAPPGNPFLVHIDAYRLNTLDDLDSIGGMPGEDCFGSAVVVIEWADRLGELLPDDVLRVHLRHEAAQLRHIQITASVAWSDRWAKLCSRLSSRLETPTNKARTCIVCGKSLPLETKTFPFCSDRCRMIDLGRWLQGEYLISCPLEDRDLDE